MVRFASVFFVIGIINATPIQAHSIFNRIKTNWAHVVRNFNTSDLSIGKRLASTIVPTIGTYASLKESFLLAQENQQPQGADCVSIITKRKKDFRKMIKKLGPKKFFIQYALDIVESMFCNQRISLTLSEYDKIKNLIDEQKKDNRNIEHKQAIICAILNSNSEEQNILLYRELNAQLASDAAIDRYFEDSHRRVLESVDQDPTKLNKYLKAGLLRLFPKNWFIPEFY